MNRVHDAVVIGAGVMGSSTALHLARGGLDVALVDRGAIFREASGVNAATLTLHMTRAALVPYAMRGWQMWMSAREWLGDDLNAVATDGLSLAFTEAEVELLHRRAEVRRAHGAPIDIITARAARAIDPGLSPAVLAAAHAPIDGFNSAYLAGRAFRAALLAARVEVHEFRPVTRLEPGSRSHTVFADPELRLETRRIVLAGGVWLEPMFAWLGIDLPIQCLVNQLVVTERMRPVMRSVVSVANGKLSLKQFANGTVLIGGGWQGIGDRERGGVEAVPQNLIGNMRLARYAIPALAEGRVARVWLGLEAETADALPVLGPVPGFEGIFAIGSVHSGYTSGPFMGKLLADHILGRAGELPLFDPGRLMPATAAQAAPG